MLPLILAGVAVTGGIMSAIAQAKSDEERAKAAEQSAVLKDIQAQEVIRRTSLNIELERRQNQKLIGAQVGAYAKGGVQVNTGSSLTVLEETMALSIQNIKNMRDQGDYDAYQLGQEAGAERNLAGGIRRAAPYKAAGTILGAAGRTADLFGTSPKTKSIGGDSSSYNADTYYGKDQSILNDGSGY